MTAKAKGDVETLPVAPDGDPVSTVPAAPAKRLCRVSLSETTVLRFWRDPRTGLEVVRTPREVPVEQIGEATRQSLAVVIEEIDNG